ncbi:SWIM zinc finger family protein [Peribacillus sp. SCS-37]|uniref:SWIM zinc finger family protein n=1 Tax=Paraperibacillus esterisolvens TaxID=3115296 RepID=UPI0039061E51
MDALLRAGETILDYLDPREEEVRQAVQRGFLLYSQGLVYKLADYGDYAEATVQDLVPARVTLQIDHPLSSSCSCEEGLFCRHQIAVFLSAYSRTASVTRWLARWKTKQEEPPAELEEQTHPSLIRARELLKTKKDIKRSFSSWKSFVEETFHSYIISNKTMQEYMLDRMWSSFNQRIKEKAPIEREWRSLYDFVVLYTVLLECIHLLRTESSPKVSLSFFHDLAENYLEELQDIAPAIGRQAKPFAFDDFLEGIKGEAWQLLEGRDSLMYERIDLYRSLWRHMLKNGGWRSDEADRLERLSQDKHPAEQALSYQVALIHLLLLNGEDERAVLMLEKMPPAASPFLYSWLQLSVETGNEKRSIFFIEHITRRIQSFLNTIPSYYERTSFVRNFSMPIRVFCQETKRMDLLERFYRETLPFSTWDYSRILFEREEYQKWVELQIFAGDDVSMVSSQNIKILQAHDPSLLLPLYHHAVLTSLGLKNRQAYKAAVRHLKKLRTLYKKLKQEDRFAEFIENLSQSTKRLRAFQEELQRGKLIHAE